MTHTSLSISVCLLLLIKYSRQVQPYVLALCFLAGKLNKKSLLSCAVVVASRELFTTGCALIVERRHHLKDRPRDLLIIGPRPVFFVSFCLFVFFPLLLWKNPQNINEPLDYKFTNELE